MYTTYIYTCISFIYYYYVANCIIHVLCTAISLSSFVNKMFVCVSVCVSVSPCHVFVCVCIYYVIIVQIFITLRVQANQVLFLLNFYLVLLDY